MCLFASQDCPVRRCFGLGTYIMTLRGSVSEITALHKGGDITDSLIAATFYSSKARGCLVGVSHTAATELACKLTITTKLLSSHK